MNGIGTSSHLIGDALPHRLDTKQLDSDFLLALIPYLTRICFLGSQLFERQVIEDGDLTTRVWAADLDPAPEGEEDPDDDDNIPIPRVKPRGKDSDYTSVVRISDEEDDDCHILELLDPMPISWAPASVLAKTDAGAGASRKWTTESETEEAQTSKRTKRVTKKPSRIKKMPTSHG